MKSALFVDFDNVYSQLRQLQPDAAERFARQPSEWITWLIRSLALPEPHDDGAQRRLLVRRCYLNPNWYQSYRHAFLRAGFEIVDCPPVTSQGKTSTDIHMVLDIIDLLQHETRCDEFIVFSADADFTPVLRKLRRYDRRTTVLAIGYPSAAYQASADLMINERVFVREALGLGQPTPETTAIPASSSGPADEVPELRSQEVRAPGAEARAGATVTGQTPADPVVRTPPRTATPDELTLIAMRLSSLVEESAQPLSSGALASRLRQEFPGVLENWNGQATFKAFFRSLKLSRLLWLSGSGGRVLDTDRHTFEGDLPEQDADSPWAQAEAIFPVVREISELTGAPALAPRDLQAVIDALVQALLQQDFKLATAVQSVCRSCLEEHGLRVRPRDVNFLIRGMQMNGHDFAQGPNDKKTLLTRLLRQMLFLCEREQKVLSAYELERLQAWVGLPATA